MRGHLKEPGSRICSDLDEVVDSVPDRSLDDGPYRCLWPDALTQKVRESGRIVNVSVVVAHGCQRRWQAGDRRHGGGRP